MQWQRLIASIGTVSPTITILSLRRFRQQPQELPLTLTGVACDARNNRPGFKGQLCFMSMGQLLSATAKYIILHATWLQQKRL